MEAVIQCIFLLLSGSSQGLWMEMQEHLDTTDEDHFTPQLAAEIFASASMHYDITPASKSMIAKLIADRPNMHGDDDSELDDEDEN